MKILVIDGGGRGHVIVAACAKSPHVTKLWSSPGNPGTGNERLVSNGESVINVGIATKDIEKLLAFAKEVRPDLTIVGADDPLALGIVDLFINAGLRIWGPTKKAARFEWSKIWAYEFMAKFGIPAPYSRAFNVQSINAARDFIRSLKGRCATKADGLALGKGALICKSVREADEAIDQMLVKKIHGAAGENILIQELEEGTEVSLHVICDKNGYKLFPTSQDHKRVREEVKGDKKENLNTGGMGTYSPTPFLSPSDIAEICRTIVRPWYEGCKTMGIDFTGILYPGIILTKRGPKVLEFNARFGDPETQVYLTRLESDFVEMVDSSLSGKIGSFELKWSTDHAVCVIMASGGYPDSKTNGKEITGILRAEQQVAFTKVFHAGTAYAPDSGKLVTNGGRVLGVTSRGPDLYTARERAYDAVSRIHFETAHYRKDIALQALNFAQ